MFFIARRTGGLFFWMAATGAVLALVVPLRAQLEMVTIQVPPEQVGLGGAVRQGTWVPMLVSLENHSSQARKVICEWSSADVDGDEVLSRRLRTIPPGVSQTWLYASPAIPPSPRQPDWRIRVIEVEPKVDNVADESGRLLTIKRIGRVELVEPRDRIIGVVGTPAFMGLDSFQTTWTQHEACQFLRDLTPQQIPDEWYGLSMLQALIWTPRAGSPDAPIMRDRAAAIREWVRRGGHLVIILPAAGGAQLWQSSQLADILPAVDIKPIAGIRLPGWLGQSTAKSGPQSVRLDALSLWPVTDRDHPTRPPGTGVLLTGWNGEPLVVARAYGIGRVTLVGLDITDERLARLGLPSSYIVESQNPINSRLWAAVFGWRCPVYPEDKLKEINGSPKARVPTRDTRTEYILDKHLLPRLIAMSHTATLLLLGSILVFGVYWLLAGPLGFAVLRAKGQTRQSWVLFAAVVLAFTVITWLGAMVFRDSQPRIEHFSVLDFDVSGQQTHAHSWLSLFVPRHERALVQIDPKRPFATGDTIASPGIIQTAVFSASSFVDPQRYVQDCSAPWQVTVPMRATAKDFELDYMTPPGVAPEAAGSWPMFVSPTGLRGTRNSVSGTLVHHLSGTLTNILVLYCPGDGQEPRVWRGPWEWPAGSELNLSKLASGEPLYDQEMHEGKPVWRGYLGQLIQQIGGGQANQPDVPQTTVPAVDQTTRLIEMLSFYGTLPAPRYWPTDHAFDGATYSRLMGRQLDLSSRLWVRGVIVMGHLPAGPVPIPIAVDGREVPSRGWTVVRWMSPVE